MSSLTDHIYSWDCGPNAERVVIPSEQPTLAELLAEERFGLSLAVGGTDAPARPVLGAHTVEVERPSRWLAPGWIMLTAGLRLHGEPEEQQKLIEELDEHGVTAMGLAMGVGFDAIPEPLAEAARERSFPVFAIPYTTTFRNIEAYVHRARLHTEMRTGQRVIAAQRYLFDSLVASTPLEELLHRLEALTQTTVWLFDDSGRCCYTSDAEPGEDVWAEIARRPATVLTFEAHGTGYVAVPVPDDGEAPRWLVLAGAEAALSEPFIKGAAQAAAGLLVAVHRLDDTRRRQEESIGSGLLDALLGEFSPTDLAITLRRAAALKVEIEGSFVVACEAAAGPSEELGRRLSAVLRSWRVPGLVAVREERVIALVSSSGEAPTDLLRSLTDTESGIRIGVGGEVTDVDSIRRSMREAVLALETSPADGTHLFVPGAEFDLTQLLLDGDNRDLVVQRSTEMLAPLRENDLLKTLATYFACDMNVGHAAYALDVHPNTIRHRLQRIEQLLGSSLQRPATVAALQVALRCSEVDY